MGKDLLIKGGTLLTASDVFAADVLVRDGRISCVGEDLETEAEVVDASNLLVMPGGIDTHVHIDHPIDRMGIRTADDFYSGTIAAACGGVTTLIDFALQREGDSLEEALDHRISEAREAVVDLSFHVIVTDVRDEVLDEIPRLIERGFPTFKIYMTYADKLVGDAALLQVLIQTGKHGGLVYLHCENDCAVTHLIQQNLTDGRTDPWHHASSRPPAVEGEATRRAILMAEVARAPVCIAHVTSEEAASHVEAARRNGLPVAAETCPQYLVLTEEEYDPSRGFESAKYVCSPPLRHREHRQALWEGLRAGAIQQVASDHAPFRFKEQKERGKGDFTAIPNGLPGVETRLALLYSEGVAHDRISASRFVELVATNPAKIFGLYPQKGTLAVGADADILLLDPDGEVEVDHATLHSKVDYSPYQGMKLRGAPVMVFSGGELIAEGGEPCVDRGRGRVLERHPITPHALP